MVYDTSNPYTLLTKPTQFQDGKTEDIMNQIIKRYKEYLEDSSIRFLDVVITENSLDSIAQFKLRVIEHFSKYGYKDAVIRVLSSKGAYKDIRTVVYDMVIKQNEEIPNVLILCCHPTRVCRDLTDLVSDLSRSPTICKYKFCFSFDEAHENTTVIKKFIQQSRPYLKKEIIGILFVTATPTDRLFKITEEVTGQKNLANMNYNNPKNFNEALKKYRDFKDHNFIEHNNETNNPLEYIEDVFSKNLIDESKRKIIFAPGHVFRFKKGVGSHDEIVSYFNNKNYCVFLMNGDFKGFIYPCGKKTEIEFDLQIRDILRGWNMEHPYMNLAITGNKSIEKGITFNTIGFNFTDMIFSKYHSKSKVKAVQMTGRGSGGKEYVLVMNIICTSKFKNIVINYKAKTVQICSSNPEYINSSDLSLEDSAIPVKIIVKDDNLLNTIIGICDKKSRDKKDKDNLHKILIEGIRDDKISLIDKNNVKKFIIEDRIINIVRMFKRGDKKEVRRLKEFNNAHENFKNMAQPGNKKNYSIDLSKDEYINDGYKHEKNVIWVTYRF